MLVKRTILHKYAIAVASTIFVVKAYHLVQRHPPVGRPSNYPNPTTEPVRQTFRKNSRPEIREPKHLYIHPTDDSSSGHRAGSSATAKQVGHKGNHQKMFFHRAGQLHSNFPYNHQISNFASSQQGSNFAPSQHSSNAPSSQSVSNPVASRYNSNSMNQSPNKSIDDYNHHGSYPLHKLQPKYSLEETYKTQMDNQHILYHSRPKEQEDRLDEDGRNLRHKSTEAEKDIKHYSHYDQYEAIDRKPVSDHRSETQYPLQNTHDEKNYYDSKNPYYHQPSVDLAPGYEKHYDHLSHHQFVGVPHQNGKQSTKDSHQYPEQHHKQNEQHNYSQRDAHEVSRAEDRRTYQNHQEEDAHYHERPTDHTSDKDPHRHRILEEKEPSNSRDQQSNENPMRYVSTKKDMLSAPSESDRDLNEEHDGFLDMGAYTDKQGSFGWYADFPVGKEHDKVTYSFS